VAALAAAKAIPKAKSETVLKEVVERERQATTGIGRGIGIPHARSGHVKQVVLAIGRAPRGVEFGAVDGERVRVILLLISPKEANAEHLQAMKAIVSIARDPYQRQRLISCSTAESFLDLLAEIGEAKT
jgi:mannitol/fructose-specific phosphotransferase system IIA component (Ntr-type)